jgi:hypothetical protein
MNHKPTNEFTEDEKNWMNTVAVNYILAHSDGFRLGYAQAVSDFTANIIDYWKNSDDEPQQSVLDAIVDLGIELERRKARAVKNKDEAIKAGYEQYYNWQYKHKEDFGAVVNLYTKADAQEEEKHDND